MRFRILTLLVAMAGALAVLVVRVPQVSLLESHASEALTPIQRGLTGAVDWLGDLGQSLLFATELKTENERLRAEIEALRSSDVRIRQLENENAQLRAQLGYHEQHPEQELMQASVIAREPTDILHAITIDKGRSHGITEGMTVVTPAGLVGRTIEVGPLSSQVLLITDTKASVSGVFVDSRAQGMIYGRRQRQLTMRYIDQMEQINVGDWVVTSSMGGSYPPGIPVGRVVYVRQRDIEPFQEATLVPAVDFTKIETVMVITSFVPATLE